MLEEGWEGGLGREDAEVQVSRARDPPGATTRATKGIPPYGTIDQTGEEYQHRGLRLVRFQAKRAHFQGFQGLLLESQGQNLVVTVVYVPCSLGSGCNLISQKVFIKLF